jgi:hypothetical protein
MTTNKTKATEASVDEYIASRAGEEQLADVQVLMQLLGKISGEKPKMWGPSIVGYGLYSYANARGKLNEMCRIGFAIRGRELVVYVDMESEAQQALLKRLGRHRVGKVCLYLRRLSDVDLKVLQQLIKASLAENLRRYP